MKDLARAHVAFEQIHPFLDGNGRTGRLLTNLLLVRAGLPPAVIFRRDRERYLTLCVAPTRATSVRWLSYSPER